MDYFYLQHYNTVNVAITTANNETNKVDPNEAEGVVEVDVEAGAGAVVGTVVEAVVGASVPTSDVVGVIVSVPVGT